MLGSFWLDSVALLADAAHNVSDGVAVGIALVAASLSMRGAAGRRTFGWGRVEILAALVNGLTLLGLGVLIAIEAIGRLGDPPDVQAPGVILFGLAGMAVNGAAVVAMVRAGASRDDLNLRGALLHTIADVAGSVGVVLAGVLVAAFGWNAADPVIALLVAALCVVSARGLIAEPVRILLERAPPPASTPRRSAARCAPWRASARCTTSTRGRSRAASTPSRCTSSQRPASTSTPCCTASRRCCARSSTSTTRRSRSIATTRAR